MKNPLNKRFLRELRSEFGKYALIFILMISCIGFISGFLVADNSIIKAYNGSYEKYNMEDGNFTTSSRLSSFQRRTIEKEGVKIYDNIYLERKLTTGSTLRIFENRTEVNKACLLSGKMPEKTYEVAIDRLNAKENNISIGDTLSDGTHELKVCGLVALPDYSCLFQHNTDSMFDNTTFGIAVVTPETWKELGKDDIVYCYSWKYNVKPADEAEESDVSEDLMKAMNKVVSLTGFIPSYQNQAIQFTGEDMTSDRTMMTILLYIIIAIMAFVFAITSANTIQKESTVIGTLRASGYTKKELIRHYMTVPTLVTLIAALVGNILGYTVLRLVCASMYYGSYSLPTYVTVWNGDAFIKTTIIPIVLMVVINYVILRSKLSLSPLKFIRKDLKKKQKTRVMHLSHHIPFLTRFNLRIIFQNRSSYLLMFLGILFANFLLIFGLSFPPILKQYQADVADYMICDYQYFLQVPVSMMAMDDDTPLEDTNYKNVLEAMVLSYSLQTSNPDAEKFSAYSLLTTSNQFRDDEITLYGIVSNSKYFDMDLTDDDVYISAAYAEKYQLEVGDTVTLKESYEDKTYDFKITGIYDYEGGTCIFMTQKALNKMLDYDADSFSGYLSNSQITDIDSKYIGSTITIDDMTKISRQLLNSMGNMMYLVDGFAIMIFIVLIYLLSKIIIEKNTQSISMVKILGYNDGEVSRLYIMTTSAVVILSMLISIPLEGALMVVIFKLYMYMGMSGWIPFTMPVSVYVKMAVLGIGTYLVVAFLEYRKIRKVKLDEALKNVE